MVGGLPPQILRATREVMKRIEAAYGYKGAATDAVRVAFLFERYQQLASLLPVEKVKKPAKITKIK